MLIFSFRLSRSIPWHLNLVKAASQTNKHQLEGSPLLRSNPQPPITSHTTQHHNVRLPTNIVCLLPPFPFRQTHQRTDILTQHSRAFHEAYLNRRGSILAKHLTPTSKTFTALAYSTTPEKKLRDIWGEVFPNRVFSPCYSEQEAKAWVDVFAAWFEVAWAVERGHGRGRADWVAAYDAMAEMAG